MSRVHLYVQDSVSKRFLQSGWTVEELKASKSTIMRWNNEQGHPHPEKGATLTIESLHRDNTSGVISSAVFGASRLRWKDDYSLLSIHNNGVASRANNGLKSHLFPYKKGT